MATDRMPPLPEFLSQGVMLLDQSLRFKILKPLMHKIQRIVDQLSGLFRRHGGKCEGMGRMEPKRFGMEI
jgi:hypothetical protein